MYNVLVVKSCKNKKVCLKINGKQSVKLRNGSIMFKNHFKQLAVPFKINADFESFFKGVKGNDNDNNASYTKKYKAHIPCSFAYKVVCIDGKFSKPVVIYRGKNAFNTFIEAILKEHQQMNIHVIIQVKKIQEFDVIQFYLNHLQFSNVSTDTTVILKEKMLNEKST